MTNSQQYQARVGDYYLFNVLGEGKFSKVFLARKGCPINGNKYGLKLINEGHESLIQQESSFLKRLGSHPNIIGLVDSNCSAPYYNSSGIQQGNRGYIVMELGEQGDLFSLIVSSQENTSPLPEPVVRQLFHQLLSGLQHCHSNGVCHHDMKLENIVVTKDFTLKLADFGLAVDISDQPYIKSQSGTPDYWPPEIHIGRQYKGTQIDLFALGIMLFLMLNGEIPPFPNTKLPNKQNPTKVSLLYWLLNDQERNKDFWSFHTKTLKASDEFKDLFLRMLHKNPNQRLTIEQIQQHPWYNQEVATSQEVYSQLLQRWQFNNNHHNPMEFQNAHKHEDQIEDDDSEERCTQKGNNSIQSIEGHDSILSHISKKITRSKQKRYQSKGGYTSKSRSYLEKVKTRVLRAEDALTFLSSSEQRFN